MKRRNQTNDKYQGNGLVINPVKLAKGDTARVRYSGLLASSGADRLYVHVGYGHSWDSAIDYKMIRTEEGFEVQVPVSQAGNLNLCFHDPANNWDNNSGDNYSFEVNLQ